MSDNTSTNQFVTIPAGVVRAAIGATSKDLGRYVLGAFQVHGKLVGGKLWVTVAACDSYRLFTADYDLEPDFFGGITEEFEWLVRPNNKLGTALAVRVERVGNGNGAFEVTTYKGKSSLPPMARAAAKVNPDAWHMWDEPDGDFPSWKQLMPDWKNLNAAAGWVASSAYVQDAYKALHDATNGENVTFDGMNAKPETSIAGPLLFSAHSDDVRARYLIMPIRDDGTLVVGRSRRSEADMVDKKAYDEMCALYRKHALREEELEAEVKRLQESTPDGEYEKDLREKFQARNLELVGRIEELEAELAKSTAAAEALEDGIEERDNRIAELEKNVAFLEVEVTELEAEPEEDAKIVKFTAPVSVVDDGVFLTIDTSAATGFIVRSADGSPLLLLSENSENFWLTGAFAALRERVAEVLPQLNWSAKRKAWWLGKAKTA